MDLQVRRDPFRFCWIALLIALSLLAYPSAAKMAFDVDYDNQAVLNLNTTSTLLVTTHDSDKEDRAGGQAIVHAFEEAEDDLDLLLPSNDLVETRAYHVFRHQALADHPEGADRIFEPLNLQHIELENFFNREDFDLCRKVLLNFYNNAKLVDYTTVAYLTSRIKPHQNADKILRAFLEKHSHTDLQHAQLDYWVDSGKSPTEVFCLLNFDHGNALEEESIELWRYFVMSRDRAENAYELLANTLAIVCGEEVFVNSVIGIFRTPTGNLSFNGKKFMATLQMMWARAGISADDVSILFRPKGANMIVQAYAKKIQDLYKWKKEKFINMQKNSKGPKNYKHGLILLMNIYDRDGVISEITRAENAQIITPAFAAQLRKDTYDLASASPLLANGERLEDAVSLLFKS